MLQRLFLSAAVSLLLTEAVELAGAYAFGVRGRAGLRIVFIANLLTNPAVVLLSILVPRYVFPDCSYRALVAGLELAAWLAEALIYVKYREILFPERKEGILRAVQLSSLLNLFSFLAGKVL